MCFFPSYSTATKGKFSYATTCVDKLGINNIN